MVGKNKISHLNKISVRNIFERRESFLDFLFLQSSVFFLLLEISRVTYSLQLPLWSCNFWNWIFQEDKISLPRSCLTSYMILALNKCSTSPAAVTSSRLNLNPFWNVQKEVWWTTDVISFSTARFLTLLGFTRLSCKASTLSASRVPSKNKKKIFKNCECYNPIMARVQ